MRESFFQAGYVSEIPRIQTKEERLEERALRFVERLEEAKRDIIPQNIDTIHIIAGTWGSFSNSQRINAGLNLYQRIAKEKEPPLLFINGNPQENQEFDELSIERNIPNEKILVIQDVSEGQLKYPILNTKDQAKSFFEQLNNPLSPLFESRNIAEVSHTPHFIRIPFYYGLYKDLPKSTQINFFALGINGHEGKEYDQFKQRELEKLTKYANLGHLCTEPIKMGTLLTH